MHRFNLEEFISSRITGRPTSLFLEDLSRNESRLESKIRDKAVLVIGGAGTIGSSYVKAILRFRPQRLFVVDVNENGLTELTRDLRSTANLSVPDDYKTYPLDYGQPIFERLLEKSGRFDIVANFAAHKHVRSEKDEFSIAAMIENNIFKTKRLLDLLVDEPPQHFFCVSTDKAANPVNVMGASKKIMEDVILSYADSVPVTTARFANVAFSNGSLLFGFLERMIKQQPLSAPADVRRYFVSPAESGELCLLACVLGESGDIFFPKLDPEEMKSFADIAVDFLEAYGGFEADRCETEEVARQKALRLARDATSYPVFFFNSDTSGEKPYEEFYTGREELDLTSFAQLGVIRNASRRTRTEMKESLDRLSDLIARPATSKTDIVAHLHKIIPTFSHVERGKNLDDRM